MYNDWAEYDIDDSETLYCSVCCMNDAMFSCSSCGTDLCEICVVEDERIFFCYACWMEREAELVYEEKQA